MNKSSLACALLLVLAVCSSAIAQETQPMTQPTQPSVLMKTSMGDITIRLFEDKAPISVENFLSYVDEGHYDGTVFHRIIPTFMIQGGGFTADMARKSTHKPIKNEATNGLSNRRGTVAMARTGVVDSATCQFFINVVDNTMLDHKNTSARGYGYAVFGEVTDGMDVVDKIKAVRTTAKDGMRDVPVEPVVIESVKRLE
jgi:cyclophilin family peptidyl-prolyl cis-trans isomerase